MLAPPALAARRRISITGRKAGEDREYHPGLYSLCRSRSTGAGQPTYRAKTAALEGKAVYRQQVQNNAAAAAARAAAAAKLSAAYFPGATPGAATPAGSPAAKPDRTAGTGAAFPDAAASAAASPDKPEFEPEPYYTSITAREVARPDQALPPAQLKLTTGRLSFTSSWRQRTFQSWRRGAGSRPCSIASTTRRR